MRSNLARAGRGSGSPSLDTSTCGCAAVSRLRLYRGMLSTPTLVHWSTSESSEKIAQQARAIRLDAHGRITSPHPNPARRACGKTRRVPFHPLYPLIVSSSVSPPSPDNSSPSCISCRSVVDRRRAFFGIPEVFQSETEQNHRGGCAHSPLLPFFRSVW
jgi:hypothetical protein